MLVIATPTSLSMGHLLAQQRKDSILYRQYTAGAANLLVDDIT